MGVRGRLLVGFLAASLGADLSAEEPARPAHERVLEAIAAGDLAGLRAIAADGRDPWWVVEALLPEHLDAAAPFAAAAAGRPDAGDLVGMVERWRALTPEELAIEDRIDEIRDRANDASASNRWEDAYRITRDAAELFPQAPWSFAAMSVRRGIATTAKHFEKHDEEAAAYRERAAAAEVMGWVTEAGHSYWYQANAEHARGAWREYADALRSAAEVYERIGWTKAAGQAHVNRGAILCDRLQDYDAAITAFDAGEDLARASDDRGALARAGLNRAVALHAAGRTEEAAKRLRDAEADIRASAEAGLLVSYHANLALYLGALGRREEAAKEDAARLEVQAEISPPAKALRAFRAGDRATLAVVAADPANDLWLIADHLFGWHLQGTPGNPAPLPDALETAAALAEEAGERADSRRLGEAVSAWRALGASDLARERDLRRLRDAVDAATAARRREELPGLHAEAAPLLDGAPWSYSACSLRFGFASHLFLLARHGEGREAYRRAAEAQRALGCVSYERASLHAAAQAAEAASEFDAAAADYDEEAALCAEMGWASWRAQALVARGRILVDHLKRPEEAVEVLREARRDGEASGAREIVGFALQHLGVALAASGRTEEAAAFCREVIAGAGDFPPLVTAWARFYLGSVEAAGGRHAEALESYATAEEGYASQHQYAAA